jgi:transposase
MTERTTRKTEYNGNNNVLFLAFELGASKWTLGFSTGFGQKPRRRSIDAGNTDDLQQEIGAARDRFGLPADAQVVSCYEAGRDGFWLDHYLASIGIKNHVVDSASIEVNRRKRRAKSDGLDVEKLLMLLMRFYYLKQDKVWRVVRVPTPEEEDSRQLHRELKGLKKDKTRITNRIKGLLATQGIKMKALDLSDAKLESIRLWNGKPLQEGLKSRLQREWHHVEFLKKQIRELKQKRLAVLKEVKRPDVRKIRQLSTLRAVGPESSWVIVQELFGWRRFENRKQVGSLVGVTPTPYDSGASVKEQGISKAGNRHVRAIAIEVAWSWIRHQPQSKHTLWFLERFGDGGKRARKVGIVAVARRLMIDFWRFLEYGVLPEGALLKSESLKAKS